MQTHILLKGASSNQSRGLSPPGPLTLTTGCWSHSLATQRICPKSINNLLSYLAIRETYRNSIGG